MEEAKTTDAGPLEDHDNYVAGNVDEESIVFETDELDLYANDEKPPDIRLKSL